MSPSEAGTMKTGAVRGWRRMVPVHRASLGTKLTLSRGCSYSRVVRIWQPSSSEATGV